MRAVKKLLILALIFLYSSAFSQIVIEGETKDVASGMPLPFVSIQLSGSNRGTISNADGLFRFMIDTGFNDQLQFSCMGYQTENFFISELEPIIYLTPTSYELDEIEVLGLQFDIYDLFDESVREAKSAKEDQSARSFFSLLSTINDTIPLEIIEAFYQTQFSTGNGIYDYQLKNGRFGALDFNGNYFFSLNTAAAIEKMSEFFSRRVEDIADVPFYYSGKKLKKRYTLKLQSAYRSQGRDIAIITFSPNSNPAHCFSGLISIDLQNRQFMHIQLFSTKLEKHPFLPINPSDRLNDVSINFHIYFDTRAHQDPVPNMTSMNYSFTYHSAQSGEFKVETECFLVLYDRNNSFHLPLIRPGTLQNDYDKILIIPFNEQFWANNYMVPQSHAIKTYESYLQKRGVLVNYGGSLEQFDRGLIFWDKAIPLFWKDIPVKPAVKKEESMDYMNTSRYTMDQSSYELTFGLMVDLNENQEGCYSRCQAFFNKSESFYGVQRNPIGLEAIRLQFNLAQLYAKRTEDKISAALKTNCIDGEIEKIYLESSAKLESELFKLRSDIQRGQEREAFMEWKNRIDTELSGYEE